MVCRGSLVCSKVAPPLAVLLTGAYHPPVSHPLAVIPSCVRVLVFASWYAGLIASGLSLAGILSVIAAGLHLLRMVNSVHTSHQLRTSQRGGGFSFAGKWSLAHPSGGTGFSCARVS